MWRRLRPRRSPLMLPALAPQPVPEVASSTWWEGGSGIWGTGVVSTLGHGQREATAFSKHDTARARQERPLSVGHGPAGHWDADCQARGNGRMGPARAGRSVGRGRRGEGTSLEASRPHGEALPQRFPAGGDVTGSQSCFVVLVVRKDLDMLVVMGTQGGEEARVREVHGARV